MWTLCFCYEDRYRLSPFLVSIYPPSAASIFILQYSPVVALSPYFGIVYIMIKRLVSTETAVPRQLCSDAI